MRRIATLSGLVLFAAACVGQGTASPSHHDDRFDASPLAVPADAGLTAPQRRALSRHPGWTLFADGDGRFALRGADEPGAGSARDRAFAFLAAHRRLFDMADPAAELAPARQELDRYGWTHVRLAQRLGGVPVDGGEVIVHLDARGDVRSANGRYFPRLAVPAAATLDRDAAVAAASRGLASPKVEGAELLVRVEDGAARFVWRVTLRADAPHAPSRPVITVDARTGARVAAWEGLESVSGSGVGVKGDTKTFDVTGSGSSYSLQSMVLNPGGIVTYTAGQVATQPGTLITSTSPTSWDTGVYGAGSGVDAYYYQGLTYQYYLTIQKRNGIDGNNLQQVSTVHYDQQYDNAYWDGQQMVFGDGDGTNFIAFGAGLDVIGHELTHGVTQYTSNLAYQDQTGALNEANSDIMGTFIELWAGAQGKNHPGNWLIGEDIVPAGSQYAPALRDMAHPKNVAMAQPDNMSGYVNTTSDNGGVHTNSGIINNAAYLMTMGGTNDTSGLAVSGMGVDKAEQVYYLAASQYYTSSTDFAGAAQANLTAAAQLYPKPSAEYAAVREAFEAVGLLSVCTPACAGKVCGADDGCGGPCAAGSGCTNPCTPQCSGKLCGVADGCGSTCQAGSGCCAPACSGKTCGAADGCGGTCAAGSGCCAPACSGKTCGDADGCGGTCQAGSGCTVPCTPTCTGKACGQGDGCGNVCQAGSGCSTSCTPSCGQKVCGADDGCGGTCVSGSGCCAPTCAGKVCGTSDGCGGACGASSGCTPPGTLTVAISGPVEGAELVHGSAVAVGAVASGPNPITEVLLVWKSPYSERAFDFLPAQGDWILGGLLGDAGQRHFRVRATDSRGNTAWTPWRTVTVK